MWRANAHDATAVAKRAIEQSSTDRTDFRFPLAIYQPVTAKNVAVTIRFKPVAGKIDQAGGIAVRVTSPNDYYLVRANALEGNVASTALSKAAVSNWRPPTSRSPRASGTASA